MLAGPVSRAEEELFESSINNKTFWQFDKNEEDATKDAVSDDGREEEEEGPNDTFGTIMGLGERVGAMKLWRVQAMAFGLISPHEIRRRSVGEVTTATLEEKGFSKRGGPNDLRAGTMNRMQLCQTCDGDCVTCQGHSMHLELPVPVLNISQIPLVLNVLRCICFGCVGLRATEDILEELIELTYPGAWDTHRERRLPQISNLLRKRRRCLRCGDVCPAISAKGFTVYWSYTAKDVEALALIRARSSSAVFVPEGLQLPEVRMIEEATADREPEYELAEPGTRQRLPMDTEFIRTTLMAISHQELRLLGVDPVASHPGFVAMQVLLIPPPCVRPAVRYSESTKHRSEHDFTVWIQEIVRAKGRLVKLIEASKPGAAERAAHGKKRKTMGIRQATRNARNARNKRSPVQLIKQAADELAGIVCGYINCESSAAKTAASSRHRTQQANRKSLMTVQSGKKGQWRSNTQGKRIDYTGRTVACPTVALDPHEVGFPDMFGMTLTHLSVVQDYNIEAMRTRVRTGADAILGAKSVLLLDGTEVDLAMLQPAQREILAVELCNHMCVRHPMPDGERVIQNRQPTLRRASMMAHKIRHQPGSKVETINPAVVGASNTDFDGDAHNAAKTQGQEPRGELLGLMAVEKQVISAQSHKPLFGLIQDSVAAGYRLTAPGVMVPREEAMQAVAQCHDPGPEQRYVQRHAEQAEITGKDLFSCLLPDGFHFFQKVQRDTGADDITVHDGRMTSGRLCKRSLGSTSHGLVHALARLQGADFVISFLGDAQRLLGYWLSQHALTIGLQDCLIPEAAQQQARTLVTRAVARADNAISYTALDERTLTRTDTAVSACLRNVVTQAGSIALAATAKATNRGFRDTVDSGAKGTIVNLVQVLCCVGQQNAQGTRIGTRDARALSCFPIPTRQRPSSAAARGFVSSCFSAGLTPPEMFFHFISSWDALIDTSVRTALSGYGQRKMSKSAEDVVVQYDGTVRHSNGTVVDFVYGSDGMDSALLDPVDIPELAPTYDPVSTAHERDERTQELLLAARAQRCSAIDGLPSTTLYLPFHATQRLRQAADTTEDWHDGNRAEVAERARARLEKLCYILREKEEGKRVLYSTAFIRLHLRLALPPGKVAAYICTAANVDRLFERLEHLYFRACVQAGEAVGLLAAENIGEPFTQLVLNVFHTAGITQIASTQGIPRLKEIIDATVNIRTPSLSLFTPAGETPTADLAARLPLRPLDDFVRAVHVFYQPAGVCSAANMEHEDTRRVGRAPQFPPEFLSEQRLVIATTAMLQPILHKHTHVSPYVCVLVLDHTNPDAPTSAEAADAIRHLLGTKGNAVGRYELEESAPGMLNRFVRLRVTGSQDIEKKCREDMNRRFPHWLPQRVEGMVDQLSHSIAHSLMHKVLFGAKIGRLAEIKLATTAKPNDRFSREQGETRILTVGSCLRASWDQKELDWKASLTNDIIETQDTLGVEAAAALIFSELRGVISSGGSGIADRHVELMATLMTASGKVTALTRYGDARLGKTSAIVRASFEKQNAHIVDAGIYSETSEVRSLADSIVVGRRPPMGTGAITLILDPKYVADARRKAWRTSPELVKEAKRKKGLVSGMLPSDPPADRERQLQLVDLITSLARKRKGKVPWHADRMPCKKQTGGGGGGRIVAENSLLLATENSMTRDQVRRYSMAPDIGVGLAGNIAASDQAPELTRYQMDRLAAFRPSSPHLSAIDKQPKPSSAPPTLDLAALGSLLESLEPTIRMLQDPLYSADGVLNVEEFAKLVDKVM